MQSKILWIACNEGFPNRERPVEVAGCRFQLPEDVGDVAELYLGVGDRGVNSGIGVVLHFGECQEAVVGAL